MWTATVSVLLLLGATFIFGHVEIRRSIDGRVPRPVRCVDECSVGCPYYVNSLVVLPHPRDCGKFFYCVFRQTIVYACPENLHYNPLLMLCDWPERAGCQRTPNYTVNDTVVIEATTCKPGTKPKPPCRPKPKLCNRKKKNSTVVIEQK